MNRIEYFIFKFRGKVLNIGCFDSESYNLMFASGYKQLFGLDLILEDKKKRIMKGNVLKMKFKNEFDVIIAGELVEHFFFEDAGKLLGKCFTALKPKGELIVTTPNKKAWSNRLFHRFDTANPPEYSGDLHVFQIGELMNLVGKTGFKVKECFCLPYAKESSPDQSNFVYFVRRVVHYVLPRSLQEQIVILAEKNSKGAF